MINTYLESYKSVVKHNGYILEDKVHSTTTKDIAFQAINTYPRNHDTICIYRDRKLEEREPTAIHHKWRRSHRPSIVRKRDFRTRGRRYHWMRWRRGAPIWKERRTYITVAWAHPGSSFKVTYVDNQRCHKVRRARWRSWICASESGEPKLCVWSTTEPTQEP
jgi:hypothetical protein